jgi:hypothetical protein
MLHDYGRYFKNSINDLQGSGKDCEEKPPKPSKRYSVFPREIFALQFPKKISYKLTIF